MKRVKPESGMRDRVAELMADGLSNIAIAERLQMNMAQVGNHVSRIRKDLGWQAR